MNNPRAAFAVLGASLLGLAVILASGRDPLREDEPEEASGTPASDGALSDREAGKFKVRLAPGSTVSVEAPGRGTVICEAERILKERAVVLE